MKIFKWIVIVLVLLLVGGGALLYINLDHIVKHAVETQGTVQLQVPTTLDGVSLGLLQGTVDLSNLAIGSPSGFQAPQMLSLGGLSVDIGGIRRLRDDPIHVSSIKIDQPKLVIEQQNGKLNFKALMDQLPSNPDQNPQPQPSGEAKPIKLVIDDLSVANAHVIIRPGLDKLASLTSVAGLDKEIDIAIPAIDVKNIGNANGANNGAAIKEVVTLLITQMAAKAADSDKLPPELKILLSGNLNDVQDKLTAAAKDQLHSEVSKLEAKIPGGLGKVLQQNQTNQPGQTPGDAGQNLLNQGLGALQKAATQPKK